ncbi:MAG: HAD family hydrolase [Bacteroidales bacterium]|nr:HAD family hydrolase [Bacteroidales bacterium]
MIVLFDFDGVLVDTEKQYTHMWDAIGVDLLGEEGFGWKIKGQTLKQIYAAYVPDPQLQEAVTERLDEYERQMVYEFIPGVPEFLTALKEAGIPTAIVTSSNDKKMANVYRALPQLKSMVDMILTSEHFTRSKPDPECFLKGMELLGGTPEETVIFEDSIHGLTAARASGGKVVGLSTTFPAERITSLCDMVIQDFSELNISDLM